MTEPVVPSVSADESDERAEEQTAAPEPKRSTVRRWTGGRGSRRTASAVAVLLVLGGTVLATAAVVRHGDRGMSVRAIAPGPGFPGGGPFVGNVKGGYGMVVEKGGKSVAAPLSVPGDPGAELAPAPLPALPADQAAQKAAGAVSGGKVESLRTVPEQGGGSAWQATVVGPDGVHHLVTVDGSSGTITDNTTIGG